MPAIQRNNSYICFEAISHVEIRRKKRCHAPLFFPGAISTIADPSMPAHKANQCRATPPLPLPEHHHGESAIVTATGLPANKTSAPRFRAVKQSRDQFDHRRRSPETGGRRKVAVKARKITRRFPRVALARAPQQRESRYVAPASDSLPNENRRATTATAAENRVEFPARVDTPQRADAVRRRAGQFFADSVAVIQQSMPIGQSLCVGAVAPQYSNISSSEDTPRNFLEYVPSSMSTRYIPGRFRLQKPAARYDWLLAYRARRPARADARG